MTLTNYLLKLICTDSETTVCEDSDCLRSCLFCVIEYSISDILLAVNGEASRPAGGIFAGLRHDLFSHVKRPLSRSNKWVDGCATQPLLLSSP